MPPKRGAAAKKDEKASKKAKNSPAPKKKLSEEETAMNELANAIEDTKNFFPEPELFAKLVPVTLKDLREDRQQTTCAIIDQFSTAIEKAKSDLSKHHTKCQFEVNKFDDIASQKANEVNALEELQKQHEDNKCRWEEAKEQAKEELKIAEDEKDAEEFRLEDYKVAYNKISETLETVDEIFEEHIRAHIVGQTEFTKKIKMNAEKAFQKLCKMDLWKNEDTLLLHTLPHALFKDALERSEFERDTLNFLMQKKDKDDEKLKNQLANEKPDETKQNELRAVVEQKELALDRIKTSLKECDKQLKATIKNVKDMKAELSDLPKLFEKKKEQLAEAEATLETFAIDIIGNFELLVKRTNVVEEVIEEEEMKGEDVVMVSPRSRKSRSPRRQSRSPRRQSRSPSGGRKVQATMYDQEYEEEYME